MDMANLISPNHMFTSRHGFTKSRKPIFTPKCFSSLNSKPFECRANTLEHDSPVCTPTKKPHHKRDAKIYSGSTS